MHYCSLCDSCTDTKRKHQNECLHVINIANKTGTAVDLCYVAARFLHEEDYIRTKREVDRIIIERAEGYDAFIYRDLYDQVMMELQ